MATSENVRSGKREKVENRRRDLEKWKEWALGVTTRDWSQWAAHLACSAEDSDAT